MPQQIEIEFKTMLTEEEFNQLLQSLPFPNKPIVQVNYYFETDDFALKKKKSALRIRKKGEQFILTLKEPHKDGLLETNEPLTKELAEKWLAGKPTNTKYVREQLNHLGIHINTLKYFGSLTTERYTYEENGIHFMLDKSFFHNIVDYELEIEAPSKVEGLQALRNVLQDHRIDERKALPKIARFFQAASNNK